MEFLFKLYEIDAVIDLVAVSNDPAGEHFSTATWQINFESRSKTAALAKKYKVKQYILPSSASVYGFNDEIVDETSLVNPLTTYAKANLAAENAVLMLADQDFCVTVLRQSTVFGWSPRQRLDLAINVMTYNAQTRLKLQINGTGDQYRPFVRLH